MTQLDSIQIPQTIHDALKDTTWKKAVDEEIRDF